MAKTKEAALANIDSKDSDLLEWASGLSALHHVSLKIVLECHHVFEKCPKDDQGHIAQDQLRGLLEFVTGGRFGEIEYRRIVKKLDKDESGTVSFDEFLIAFCKMPKQRAQSLQLRMNAINKEIRLKAEEKSMSADDRVKNHGVQADFVKKYLKKDLTEVNECLQMPMTVAIFLFFALAVMFHSRTQEIFAVQEAIERDITENMNFAFTGSIPFENGRMGHKSIYDVNTIADFWSWMNIGLVPLFWAEGWDVNEVRTSVLAECMSAKESLSAFGYPSDFLINMTYPVSVISNNPCPEQATPLKPTWFFGNPVTPTYNNYFMNLGGMRMRQERLSEESCKYPLPLWNGACSEDARYWLEPDIRYALLIDEDKVDKPGGQTLTLLSELPQARIRDQLRTLENNVWVSPLTSKIEMAFPLYNPHIDMIVATYILFFFNPSGRIHQLIEPIGLFMHPYQNTWCYVMDILWLLVVFKIIVDETIEIRLNWKQLGLSKGTRAYVQFANMVDWSNVLYSIVLVVFWTIHLSRISSLQDYIDSASNDVEGNWSDETTRNAFFDEVHTACLESRRFRIMLSLYPFVLLTRFFKAFDAQPRLALVTRTMMEASVNVMHFLIVFGTVFIVFTFSSMILFGTELSEFADIGRAINTTFRILMGDFDWDEMANVGREQAGVWFCTFVCLLNLVVLNMLLAMLLDVYSSVKGSVGNDSETLFSQSHKIFCRWRERRKGNQVSLSAVLEALIEDDENVDQNDRLTVRTFIDKVPLLGNKQATRILKDALKLNDAVAAENALGESLNEIEQVKKGIGTVSTALVDLIDMTEVSTALVLSVSNKKSTKEEMRSIQRAAVTPNEDGAKESRADILWPDLAARFEQLEEKLGFLESSFLKLLPKNPSIPSCSP